jgi:6-pyruvoyltetrahydropterin/6-carboxytetrahydropterin synthase
MSNVKVTKEFTWDMAHMLAGHDGLCKNVHGHTYKMHVTLARIGDALVDNHDSNSGFCAGDHGMVVDFKVVSENIKNMIVNPLDHAFMTWEDSTDPVEHQIAQVLIRNGRKVFPVPYRPTAENMALDIFNTLNANLEESQAPITVTSVVIYETPTSYAEVTE